MTEDWITIVQEAPDWAGRIGATHYPWPQQFIDEVRLTGFSKRIPKTFAQNIQQGSRFACVHSRAVVWADAPGMTMWDLAMELAWTPDMGSADDFDPVKQELLSENGQSRQALINLLQIADEEKRLEALTEKYQLRFEDGTIGYVFLTGRVFVLDQDKDELPEEYRGYGLEPIHDVYVD